MRYSIASQRKVLSEFFNNTAVAWFAAGVIAPVIVKPVSLADLLTSLSWGLVATTVFLRLSIEYSQEKHQ